MSRFGSSAAMWCCCKEDDSAISTETDIHECSAPRVELHFNYWRQIRTKGGQSEDYLDIGLMIVNAKALSCASIYLPVKLESSNVTDLSSMFKESSIATGIFNTHLTAANASNSAWVDLTESASNSFFARVYRFAAGENGLEKGELALEECNGGTLLKITSAAIERGCEDLKDDQRLYCRLRVVLPSTEGNGFVNVITPPDRHLLSSSDNIEYIDFRLNQARNLPDNIQRLMATASRGHVLPQITRVDFLLVVGVAADHVGGHEIHKHRLLETELWKKYLAHGDKVDLQDGMVIYHWRDKIDSPDDKNRSVGDFNAFVKFRIRRSDPWSVKRYLLVAFSIGAVGSLIASAVWAVGALGVEHFTSPNTTISCTPLEPSENEILNNKLRAISISPNGMKYGAIILCGEK